ncbi:MAG: NAD-dependent epimerase/dehydratase family protein, partial [Chitinophagales bacterium]
NIPFIYASSAATYGDGKLGFSDQMDILPLQPLNPYGNSKQEFDLWALEQDKAPANWYGLKFFNVYGPNEYHKGRMASVIFHFYQQIQKEGKMRLFRSHHPEYKDGEQLRDFIYVMDVLEMIYFFMQECPPSGLYNIGTGTARTFLDLAHAVFCVLEKEPQIKFIDTPEDIRDKYQYFTEADMQKLNAVGYSSATFTLEEGVADYLKNYLSSRNYY